MSVLHCWPLTIQWNPAYFLSIRSMISIINGNENTYANFHIFCSSFQVANLRYSAALVSSELCKKGKVLEK